MSIAVNELRWIAIAISTLAFAGAAIGQGIATAFAAQAVGRNPEAESKILRMLIIGCAITESGAIYSLMISLLLIFTTSGQVAVDTIGFITTIV